EEVIVLVEDREDDAVDIDGPFGVPEVEAGAEAAVAEVEVALGADDPARVEFQVSSSEREPVEEVVVAVEEPVVEVNVPVVVEVAEPDAAAIDAEGASVVLSRYGRDRQRQEECRGRGRPVE